MQAEQNDEQKPASIDTVDESGLKIASWTLDSVQLTLPLLFREGRGGRPNWTRSPG